MTSRTLKWVRAQRTSRLVLGVGAVYIITLVSVAGYVIICQVQREAGTMALILFLLAMPAVAEFAARHRVNKFVDKLEARLAADAQGHADASEGTK